MIDFDVETTGLQPYSGKNIAFLWIFGDDEGNEACIPFTPDHTNLPNWDFDGESPNWHENMYEIQRWFDRGATEGIRAWNAKFDRGFAEMSGRFSVPGDGCWYDGMVVAHAMNEDRSVALKNVATELFGADAADPQKLLKEWLNTENKRRAKLLKDADKARVGNLKIKYEEALPCKECKGELPLDDDPALMCLACLGTGVSGVTRNRIRKAEEVECAAVIGEAAQYTDDRGEYIRANYSHVPRDIMEPYALEDVRLTRRISDVYAPRVEAMPDIQRVIEFEREAMDALFAIEMRGLPVNGNGIEYRKLEHEVISNLDPLETRVMELAAEGDAIVYAKELAGDKWRFTRKGKPYPYGATPGEPKKYDGEAETDPRGVVENPDGAWVEVDEDGTTHYRGGAQSLSEFNAKSTPQVLAALKARGADMSYMTVKDGTVAADADNLRAVDDPLAEAILAFRSEYKVFSTYVRPMIDRSYVSGMNIYKEPFIGPDSRIHATYRQVGARTGRMSCADPNMQNQPRDDLRLRYNIAAEPGYTFVTCDLTNIEMVLFAAYCGQGRLLDAVLAGEDLHVLTAKMLGLRDRKRSTGIETARQLGKTYNFSRIYGGGLRTIRRSFRCSLDEARLLKKRFDDAYPEVLRLTNRIQYKLEDDGFVQDGLISGRRFRVPPRDAYKATNYLVQGTAAALLKYAVIELHKDGCPMVALVHDEVVAYCKIEEAEHWAKLIETRLTQFPGLKDKVPLRAEADIVARWSDAKTLKEEDGREYKFDPEWANVERRYVDGK